MTSRIIIHTYTPECPGIGDFLRAAGQLYTYCKLHNIHFYLDITNPINKYFDYKKYHEDTKHFTSMTIFSSNSDSSYHDFLLSHKDTIIRTNKALHPRVDSDIYNLREIFTPNSYIINKHKQLLKQYNLIENKYTCIHIRFGDNFLVNSSNLDDRINRNQLTLPERIANCMKHVNKDYPIVLISDNYEQKKIISKEYNFICFDIEPVHTSHKPTDAQTEQTVLEFLTLVESLKICILSFSGFSKLAACYGNKPYLLFEK
jgi:hypothetical protein